MADNACEEIQAKHSQKRLVETSAPRTTSLEKSPSKETEQALNPFTCSKCGEGPFKGLRGLSKHQSHVHKPEVKNKNEEQESQEHGEQTTDSEASAKTQPKTSEPEKSLTCSHCGEGPFQDPRGLKIHMGLLHKKIVTDHQVNLQDPMCLGRSTFRRPCSLVGPDGLSTIRSQPTSSPGLANLQLPPQFCVRLVWMICVAILTLQRFVSRNLPMKVISLRHRPSFDRGLSLARCRSSTFALRKSGARVASLERNTASSVGC